jgi:RimJ/RimL family protein N-acetyltransferase
MLLVREIREEDAEDLLELLKRLDTETSFMMYEPGERKTTVAEQRGTIRSLLSTHNRTILIAELSGRLAGFLGVNGGAFRRNRHVAYLVVGVLGAFSGRGIGTALMSGAEGWAREHGIRRLELTVMAHNEAALALYGKVGFEIEGTRRGSLLVDGGYVDEHYMAKLLD